MQPFESVERLFREACGASAPLELSVAHEAWPGATPWTGPLPFVLIGRLPSAGVPLSDADAGWRHAYVQVVCGRVFAVDLRRPGPGADDVLRPYRLRPGKPGWVGPVRIKVVRAVAENPPNSDSSGSTDDVPNLRLEFAEPGREPWRMKSLLGLVGARPPCGLCLDRSAVSSVHCGLVRTPMGPWVVDLGGRGGVRVNGVPVRVALLRDHDHLVIGGSAVRIRCGQPAGCDVRSWMERHVPADTVTEFTHEIARVRRRLALTLDEVDRMQVEGAGLDAVTMGQLGEELRALRQVVDRRTDDVLRHAGLRQPQETAPANGHAPTVVEPKTEEIAPPPALLPRPDPLANGHAPPAPDAVSGVKRRVVRGGAWIVVGYGLMVVLRFSANLVLTALLAPRLFGMMALVSLFVQGLDNFSDLGLRQCVVRSPRGDEPAFLNTAWTAQVLRGLVLWLGCWLLAAPLAHFYEEPALLWLLPTVGGLSLAAGFNSTSLFLLNRRLQRGPLVFLEVGGYLASMSVVLPWQYFLWVDRPPDPDQDAAFLTRQLQVLALGTLVAPLFQLVVSHLLLRNECRPRFRWDPAARRELLHFGGWVFVSTACTFLAAQADRLVVGKLSMNVLGVYHVAAMLAGLPTLLLLTLGSQLVFPVYSRVLQAGGDLRDVFARAHLGITAFAALVVTGMVCAGPSLIECLYRSRYQDAGWLLQLLAVTSWLTILQNTRELILLAEGRTRGLALGQFVRLVSLPGLLLVGYGYGGLAGLVIGFTAAEFLRYCVTAFLVRRVVGPAVLVHDISLSLLIAGVSAAVLQLGSPAWVELSRHVRFAAQGLVVVAVWGVVFTAFWFGVRRPVGLLRRWCGA